MKKTCLCVYFVQHGVMEKQLKEQVRTMVELGIKLCGKAADVSRQTGISKPNLTRWQKGETGLPKLGDLAPLMQLVGARITLPHEKQLAYASLPSGQVHLVSPGHIVLVENGFVPYTLEKGWLSSLGVPEASAWLVEIKDAAMHPAICVGDYALVNRAETNLTSGRTYLLSFGDELLCRRVFKTPQGISLRAENPEYPEHNLEAPQLSVYGRICWVGRLF